MTPPISPGPPVAATRRDRHSPCPASAMAAGDDRGRAPRRWARAAISGTTPPKAAMLVDLRAARRCDRILPARRRCARPPPRRSRRSLVSIPSTSMANRSIAAGCHSPCEVRPVRPASPMTDPTTSPLCASARAAASSRWRRRSMVRERLVAGASRVAIRRGSKVPGDPHHRRPDHRPAVGGGGRQGAVHQGAGRGADRPPHRSGGAFARRTCRLFCRPVSRSSTFLQREDARDAFIAARRATLAELPPGAVVGTSSPRRQA